MTRKRYIDASSSQWEEEKYKYTFLEIHKLLCELYNFVDFSFSQVQIMVNTKLDCNRFLREKEIKFFWEILFKAQLGRFVY